MVFDLVLPLECGGCGAPSTRWCQSCAAELALRPDQPHLITPRADPGVPVFALGRYAGARRSAIVAAKEHGRADLAGPLGAALAEGLARLLRWGVVTPPVTLVAAPTRASAARRRGGDPVARIACIAARGHSFVHVVPALRIRAMTRDSVGLSPAERLRNIGGRVRLCRAVTGDAVLIDDVVTTGATATESVRVLQTGGAGVICVLAIAHA